MPIAPSAGRPFFTGCEQAPLRGQQPESLRLCRRILTPLGDPPALPWLQARFDSSGSALHYCQHVISLQRECRGR
jgi:hypothetical protein